MSAALSKAATRAHYEAQAADSFTVNISDEAREMARLAQEPTTAADMAYSAELVRREEADAEESLALPWWFWEAAAVVFVGTIAISAVWPLGFAS